MTDKVTITLDPVIAETLRSVCQKRLRELDSYLTRKGDDLDAVELQLTKDVRANVAQCLSLVDDAMAVKA